MAPQGLTGMLGRRRRPPRGGWLGGWLGVVMAALLVPLAGCGSSAVEDEPVFRITYQATPVDGRAPTSEDLEVIRSIIQRRLDATGLVAVRVGAQEPDRILVEAGPASAFETVSALSGATGRLDLVPLGEDPPPADGGIDLASAPVLLSNDAVTGASIAADENGRRVVEILLTDDGRRVFGEPTAVHVGEYLAVMLDGQVVAILVINAPNPDGVLRVSQPGIGGYPLDEAQRLITLVRSGALPFPLQELGVEQR